MRVRFLEELSRSDEEALVARNRAPFREKLPEIQRIINQVREGGDAALRHLTRAFDRVDLESLEASPGEVEAAHRAVGAQTRQALQQAIAHVERYHALQIGGDRREVLAPGIQAGWLTRPIERVGLYAPGGRAVYPSSVIMAGVPARLAGCPLRVLCVPPAPDGGIPPATLVAADLVGVHRVFKVGGAQAIAALAYGTETVPRVDKIFGAGNLWVTGAKVLVSQDVAIDLPAGPSEVLILADETAPARWVAADLLAQAEHGPDSVCLLVTPSLTLAQAVAAEVLSLAQGLPTQEVALKALADAGAILVGRDWEACLAFANRFAPEHLEVMAAAPEGLLPQIAHAGSIFLGAHTPVAAGDYAVGPNHVLPTAGHARAYSALSVAAFTRTVQVQSLSPQGLRSLGEAIITLAEVEGLPAHAQSIRVRLEEGR